MVQQGMVMLVMMIVRGERNGDQVESGGVSLEGLDKWNGWSKLDRPPCQSRQQSRYTDRDP